MTEKTGLLTGTEVLPEASGEYAYVMLITYSFDIDYVAVPCRSEEEALCVMKKYLDDEMRIVMEEHDYTPAVIDMCDTEKVLVYFDPEEGEIAADNYYEHDYAVYKRSSRVPRL